MPKALIVYASRGGATKAIAQTIMEGLKSSNVDVKIVDVTKINKPEDLEGYDAYIFGSATYHGEMMQKMKQMLFLGERANLKGKIGGAFGAYGWSGEASIRIFDTMKNIFQMEMVHSPLRVKNIFMSVHMVK